MDWGLTYGSQAADDVHPQQAAVHHIQVMVHYVGTTEYLPPHHPTN